MSRQPDMLRLLGAVADDVGMAMAPAVADGLTAMAEATRATFGAAACSIVAVDHETSEVVWVASAGEGAAQALGMRLPVTRGLTGYVANSGEAIAVDDVGRDARFASDAASDAGYVPTSMLLVPVIVDGQVVGVLSVLDRAADRPSVATDLELATAFAAVIAQLLPLQHTISGLGAALLRAAADAADDGDLASALRRAARRPLDADADVRALAADLAELRRLGAPERDLVRDVVGRVLAYASSRRRR